MSSLGNLVSKAEMLGQMADSFKALSDLNN